MLGSHAACSKQMPACKDSHQSSHTEADCAGSLFHSNKGTSAEQRSVQTEPAWTQGEVGDAGEGVRQGFCKEVMFEVVLGMKIHSQGQTLNFIPVSPAILASPASHTEATDFQLDKPDTRPSGLQASPEAGSPTASFWVSQVLLAQDYETHVPRKRLQTLSSYPPSRVLLEEKQLGL